MRSKKNFESGEFADGMTELEAALKEAGIKYIIRRHPAVALEPTIKGLLGYWPTGEWQIIIKNVFSEKDILETDISIIRGYVSFGLYEAWGMMFKEPERFETPTALIAAIIEKKRC